MARILLVFLLLLTAACSALPFQQTAPTPVETSPVLATASPTATIGPIPAGSPTPTGPVTIRVWLPPQFDPAAETPAGRLLQQRLADFGNRRPGVRIEARVKSEHGPGGLLDSLTTASAAAPLALPDLVALPSDALETAALKGLLHPIDGLTTALDDPDWYDYMRQLAHLQSSTFGLPFAGDLLLMVYRPVAVSTPPGNWQEALQAGGPLAFPAADPQSLFTLAMYLAAGGPVRDEEGRPTLDTRLLEETLTFYYDAAQSGLMPFWLTQYESEDQLWAAYQENRADMAISWSSQYLSAMLADSAAAHLPTQDGSPFTLARGWVWAVASTQAEHQALSVQLAEFLTESNFLSEWTEAAGYLPPRPSALQSWTDASLQSLLGQLALSAQPIPFSDVLNSLGPPLQEATVQVLKQQATPSEAAQAAANGLSAP